MVIGILSKLSIIEFYLLTHSAPGSYYYYYLVECYFEQLGNHLIPYNAILTWVATPQVRAEAVYSPPSYINPQHQVHVALLCMNVA